MKIGLNKKALTLIVVLAVLAGVGIRFGWGYVVPDGTVTAEGLSASAADKKQGLVDGVKNGQILYYKGVDFKKGRLGLSEVPEFMVIETWLAKADDGNVGSAVSLASDSNGELVMYTRFEDGRNVTTYVSSGEEFVLPVVHSTTIEDWIDGVWERAESGLGSAGEEKGSGTLDGKETVIFELRTNPSGNPGEAVAYELLTRLEVVVDDPLLMKRSLYEVDDSGGETLVRDFVLTEYRVLPVGSTMPEAP